MGIERPPSLRVQARFEQAIGATAERLRIRHAIWPSIRELRRLKYDWPLMSATARAIRAIDASTRAPRPVGRKGKR
jgi:hypothetical protein